MRGMSLLRRVLPRSIANALQWRAEWVRMSALPRAACDVSNLLNRAPEMTVTSDWAQIEQALLVSKGGSVNPGDRRALYALTRSLRPRAVLEIGTHLGGSTAIIALALKGVPDSRLTTVDIVDINGPEGKWVFYGTAKPSDIIEHIGCSSLTTFVTSPSIEFMSRCQGRFDLIFLDGLHDADMVYREVPLAVKLLNPGGLILLHDFFPNLKPLWSDGKVVPGPWLAIERLRSEGVPIRAQPLGKLPWPTKLGSNVTSLSYLLRD